MLVGEVLGRHVYLVVDAGGGDASAQLGERWLEGGQRVGVHALINMRSHHARSVSEPVQRTHRIERIGDRLGAVVDAG